MKLRKRMMGLLLAVAVAAGSFLGTPVRAEAANTIAKGIDVSKYQGAVNWSAVKNAGYSFAFIKIGSAKSGLDPYYAANMAGANAAGLKVGAYIYSYATTVEGAITEAQFAIAALEPYTVSYPVVFDLEDSVHKNMTPEQLASLAVAFCSTVQSAGYYPMVYSSKNWMTGKIAATPYDKWIAQYNTVCEYPNPAFWQFTSSGTVPGIDGRVDLNYQFKDYSNLIVANGFVDRGGNRYYYRNYRMQFGFVEDNGKTYFMNADGTLYKQGWLGDGVNMFYMDTKDGHMLKDLVEIGGKKYYFAANGLMQRGMIPLDGKIYLFGADGTMQYGWYTDASGMRYFQADGSMAVNATLTGENYATPVSYWMPFNGNIGMHDANWRSSFGGNIYKTNGSHGCVNLPPSVAAELYGYVEKGTPVICYYLPGTEAVKEAPGTSGTEGTANGSADGAAEAGSEQAGTEAAPQ